MEARRTCGLCKAVTDYCIPTSDGRCIDCIDAANYPTAA
jgi:hypothetical protein